MWIHFSFENGIFVGRVFLIVSSSANATTTTDIRASHILVHYNPKLCAAAKWIYFSPHSGLYTVNRVRERRAHTHLDCVFKLISYHIYPKMNSCVSKSDRLIIIKYFENLITSGERLEYDALRARYTILADPKQIRHVQVCQTVRCGPVRWRQRRTRREKEMEASERNICYMVHINVVENTVFCIRQFSGEHKKN